VIAMTHPRRRLRRVLLVALAFAGATAPSPGSADSAANLSRAEELANFTDVRVRKLHLVRPDLLQYPIVHPSYC
jgi:hypothetical protein